MPLVEYFADHDEINIDCVVRLVWMSRSNARRYLKEMIDLELLEMEGQSHSTVYRFVF